MHPHKAATKMMEQAARSATNAAEAIKRGDHRSAEASMRYIEHLIKSVRHRLSQPAEKVA